VRDELAENLLAKVMGWSDEEKARERAILQDLARYKYDEYQQYAPGRRFIESLALWLRQFETPDERKTAYDFVRKRLVFISTPELRQLVDLSFPTAIRPLLITLAANRTGINPLRVKAIVGSPAYRVALRQTLFLGLSDGARTDAFRRAYPEVSNEQIWHAYDISEEKAKSMGKRLVKDLTIQLGRNPTDEEGRFHTICLLDDFTASGTTYIRREGGGWDGKIPRIVRQLTTAGNALHDLVATQGVKIIVCIYVASDQAIRHLRDHLTSFSFGMGTIELCVVYALPPETKLDDTNDARFLRLARDDRYFDRTADDEHGQVGGTTTRLGYADCRLPVVLSHNTPNNSVFILRGEYVHSFTGLFPRISRHKRAE
jgi:hypothetical protein